MLSSLARWTAILTFAMLTCGIDVSVVAADRDDTPSEIDLFPDFSLGGFGQPMQFPSNGPHATSPSMMKLRD